MPLPACPLLRQLQNSPRCSMHSTNCAPSVTAPSMPLLQTDLQIRTPPPDPNSRHRSPVAPHTTSSRGLAAARPMAMMGSLGSFSSMRNTDVSTECSVPLSSSTRSEVPAGQQRRQRQGSQQQQQQQQHSVSALHKGHWSTVYALVIKHCSARAVAGGRGWACCCAEHAAGTKYWQQHGEQTVAVLR
jgi:hypothetical protein